MHSHHHSSGHADILAAALREFANHGFAGATTAAIARRAGVTQPLIHHHFRSKQGLWDAVLDDLFEDFKRALTQTLREVEGMERRQRITALLRTLICFTGRRPELGRIIRTESSAGGPPFDTLYNRWLSQLVALFQRELTDAIEDGTLRPIDPRLAYSLIIGACTQPFSEPETVRRAFGVNVADDAVIERYADLTTEVLLRGLAAAPPDASAP